MPIYETVFMVRPDLTETQVQKLVDDFSKILKDEGGNILKVENWGLRTLAYRINKSRKAHYTLIESDAPAPAIIELERNLRLHEDVMRSLTIRLDEKTDGPSVIMEGPSRDDRDDRKPRDFKDNKDNKENKEAA